jgi:hypothetical protein
MSDAVTSPCPTPTAPEWAREVLDRQVLILDRLAQIGMAMAEALGEQAAAAAPLAQEAAQRVHHAFDRIARSVRLTLLLQARLIQDHLSPKAAAHRKTDERKAQVLAVVEDVARTEHTEDSETAERLVRECGERLEREYFQGLLKTQPVSTVVERICEVLGLTPDWPTLSEQDWAEAEFQSGKCGPTLAEHMVEEVEYRWLDPETGGPGPVIARKTVPRKPSG